MCVEALCRITVLSARVPVVCGAEQVLFVVSKDMAFLGGSWESCRLQSGVSSLGLLPATKLLFPRADVKFSLRILLASDESHQKS